MRARDVRPGQLWLWHGTGGVVLFITVKTRPECNDSWETHDVICSTGRVALSGWDAMSAEKYYSECYTLISEGDADESA